MLCLLCSLLPGYSVSLLIMYIDSVSFPCFIIMLQEQIVVILCAGVFLYSYFALLEELLSTALNLYK